MTTPGGIPNMPAAAMTVGQLGDRLQNLSPEKLRQRSGDQFANIFASSPGGNALDAESPFGIITSLFGGFMSTVANADPADLNGPEDLPGLLTDFVEEIPVVGDIFSLMQAILGVYEGDNVTLKAVSDLFKLIWDTFDSVNAAIGGVLDFILGIANAILSAIRGVPVAGGQIADRIEDVLADMRGLNDTAHGASGLVAQVKSGIINGWSESGAAGADSGVYNTMASIRALLATGNFTRVNVTSTMTWTKPAGVTGDVVIIGIAAGTNGANGGNGGSGSSDNVGGAGGVGGGHMVQVIKADDVSTIYVSVGTNGASTIFKKNSSGGDIMLEAATATKGAVATTYGYTPTASEAGNGGVGGKGSYVAAIGGRTAGTGGSAGTRTIATTRGEGGATGSDSDGIPGTHGGSVDITDLVPCGGGGGGGGGGGDITNNATKRAGGVGGAGGFPGGGGGGGGGGTGHQTVSGLRGNGGAGGAGGAGYGIIYYKAAT